MAWSDDGDVRVNGRRPLRSGATRKLVSRPRLLLGPEPEPLWQLIAADTNIVTEVIYTAGGPEPWQIIPSCKHHIVELVINGQRRDLRVLENKQQALTQAMAWYRQYQSPYHRLAQRLMVPDTIAARSVLGVKLPNNGQSVVCELFAFHNGDKWQVLINADTRPLLTRVYQTEDDAVLDAWSLAWKLQGHASPWPAPWLKTPAVVLRAMERYERVPTIPPSRPLTPEEGAGPAAGLPEIPPPDQEVPQPFKLLHFAPVPRRTHGSQR